MKYTPNENSASPASSIDICIQKNGVITDAATEIILYSLSERLNFSTVSAQAPTTDAYEIIYQK